MYLSDILSTLRQSTAGTLLLIVQVAFTFAVLVNIYAMIDAYTSQVVSESGYEDEDSLLGVTLSPFAESEKTEESIGRWRNQIVEDLNIMHSTLGVKDVALAHGGIPFQNTLRINNFDQMRKIDQEKTSGVPNTRYSADVNTIELLGLEIIAGRDFNESDVRWVDSIEIHGGPSVIITQTMAEALFPGEDAVGKQVIILSGRRLTIIGIVKSATAVYWAPYDQYASFTAGRVNFNQGYLVRLDRSQTGDHFAAAKATVIQTLSEKLQNNDLEREVKVETMEEMKKLNLGRFIIINSIVGGVALLLILVTALGNYGQMSYTILKRTKQIGIRRALGATRRYIFNYFLLENALIATIGMIPGAFLMLGLNAIIINAMGYGQFQWQHIVFSVAFVYFVGFISALLPIIRAMRISPAIATQSV